VIKRKAFKHSDKKLNLQGALVVPVQVGAQDKTLLDESDFCWKPHIREPLFNENA